MLCSDCRLLASCERSIVEPRLGKGRMRLAVGENLDDLFEVAASRLAPRNSCPVVDERAHLVGGFAPLLERIASRCRSRRPTMPAARCLLCRAARTPATTRSSRCSTNVGRSVFCWTMTRTPLASVNSTGASVLRAVVGVRTALATHAGSTIGPFGTRLEKSSLAAALALLRIAARRAVVWTQMPDDGRAAQIRARGSEQIVAGQARRARSSSSEILSPTMP